MATKKQNEAEVQPEAPTAPTVAMVRVKARHVVKANGIMHKPGTVMDVPVSLFEARPDAFEALEAVEARYAAERPEAVAKVEADRIEAQRALHGQRRAGQQLQAQRAADARAIAAERAARDAAVVAAQARAFAAGDMVAATPRVNVAGQVPVIQPEAPRQAGGPQNMRDAMRESMAVSRRILSERADQVLIQRAIKGAA